MNPLALFTGPYALLAKWAVIGIILLSAFGSGYYKGNQHGTAKLTEYIGKQATEAVRIAKGQNIVTTKVVTKYVKVAGATQIVTQTVEKEVVKYADTNTGYCLDAAWRGLHDAAALNVLSNAGQQADGKGGAPKAAEALSTVTENYGACNRTADRLDALQDWVRQQEGVK